jgi:hypothetical protein
MATKIIKLNKNEDIAAVIKRIKGLKDRSVIFDLEKGSLLLSTSDTLRLMKKTGEVLGKKVTVLVAPNDEMGRILANKAEILDPSIAAPTSKPMARVRRSDVSPKFSDILASKRILNKETTTTLTKGFKRPKLPSFTNIASVAKLPKTEIERTSRFGLLKYALPVVILLILGLVGAYIFLPQASIKVYARSEPISRDLEIAVDKNITNFNPSELMIPGQLVVKEVSKTKNFPTTGTVASGTKATGSVTLYNFTKNNLTLKASTTTLVANGKKYFFTKDVSGIRPTGRIGAGNDQEVDTTTLIPPVSIIAAEPGEAYNLPANTKFTIDNKALGNRDVYAINSQAIGGGSANAVQILSQQDLDKAVSAMSQELVSQVEADLSQTESSNIKILPSGAHTEILAKTANKNVGDQVDSFDMTVIARVTALGFKDSDITRTALSKINEVLSTDKYLVEGAKRDSTASFKSLDLGNGRGTLSVHFETLAAYKVSANDLAKVLAGKNAIEIKEILLTRPEIDRVDVKFSPFFVRKAPSMTGKIYIQTVLSEI